MIATVDGVTVTNASESSNDILLMIDSGGFWLCLLFLNAGIWVVLAVQSSKLYRAFCSRFPKEANALLPVSSGRHPQKLLFFYQKDADVFLRSDKQLLKLKKQLDVILCTSGVLALATIYMVGFMIKLIVSQAPPLK